MAKIGFIGLGHMGLPMAINLTSHGHQVTGFDLKPEAVNAFKKQGGAIAKDLRTAVIDKDVVITMLQNGIQVAEICVGHQGFYPYSAQKLHIDCSTIDVATTREISQQAQARGLSVLDAPVSGGVVKAKAGQLTFMVGGKQEDFATAQAILACMGKKIIYTGDCGSGQAAKICNNMILGVSMIAVSEAFTLARALDLNPEKLLEVVNNSSGECWVSKNYVPLPNLLPNVPANNEYRPGFTAAMMLKDLLLSQESAAACELHLALSNQATKLYQHFKDLGYGDLDFSAIIQILTAKESLYE